MKLTLTSPFVFNYFDQDEPFSPRYADVIQMTLVLESLICSIGGYSLQGDKDNKPQILSIGAYGTILDWNKAAEACRSGLLNAEQLSMCAEWYKNQSYLAPTFCIMDIVCTNVAKELEIKS